MESLVIIDLDDEANESFLEEDKEESQKVAEAVKNAGYEVILTDTSEYRKLDGGLSCLSLRF